MFVENLEIIKCLSVFYIINYKTRKIVLSETKDFCHLIEMYHHAMIITRRYFVIISMATFRVWVNLELSNSVLHAMRT